MVFAIIDPIGTGNLKPFREEIAQIAERPTRTPLDEDSESHALSELGPADTVRDAEDAEAGAELTDEALAAGLPAEGSDFSVPVQKGVPQLLGATVSLRKIKVYRVRRWLKVPVSWRSSDHQG